MPQDDRREDTDEELKLKDYTWFCYYSILQKSNKLKEAYGIPQTALRKQNLKNFPFVQKRSSTYGVHKWSHAETLKFHVSFVELRIKRNRIFSCRKHGKQTFLMSMEKKLKFVDEKTAKNLIFALVIVKARMQFSESYHKLFSLRDPSTCLLGAPLNTFQNFFNEIFNK